MSIRTIVLAAAFFIFSLFASSPAFAKATPTPTPTVMVEQKVDYALPYPGILPDHPLYFLKRFRDQILEKLIVDPVRKIEFYMLQADKSINTAAFLAAKKSDTLSQEAMARGQKYYEQAILGASALKSEGKDVPAYLVERFTNAGAKYAEVLTELGFANLLDSFRALQSEVAKLKN